MDLFAREQQIYEAVIAELKGADKDTVFDFCKYKRIVDEYGKLLKQFQQYRQITGESERKALFLPPEKLEVSISAHYDVLTGVFSKKYLQENMERVLGTMGRKNDILSLVKVDIDHFKNYNDIYGYTAGDECIRGVADTLKSCLFRAQDFVARYSGEEFMAILPHTPEEGSRLVAERMLEGVRNLKIPHLGNKGVGFVTVSIGLVASKRTPGELTIDDFFKSADQALAEAQSLGRNQYSFVELTDSAEDGK
ncbi:MAG: GGDEF domain-containing protein [Defluviitaleaceae bacterium]|nr:GGDEF domain-containing protein [Defluviitaleaceae bacterium]